jgi:hypothetical protein
MCERWVNFEPCVNYKCPHNLFWEGLKLNLNKILITNKAFGIRNCCCLINKSWTPKEILEGGVKVRQVPEENCDT